MASPALARAVAVGPAEALLLDAGAFGLRPHELIRAGCAVAFAECVPPGGERDGFLVVHRHAGKGLANVGSRGDRVGIAVRSFRVYVDQAHLHGRKRIFEIALAGITFFSEPLFLDAPVDVLFRLPDVFAPATEAERLEAHRFQGAVAGENHEVGPGDFLAVFLLDRPQQPARLVEVAVVRPTVDGGKALVAGSGTAAAVTDPIGPGGVPRHANKERSVVAVVGRPPILRGRHQLTEVLLQGVVVEALEFLGIAGAVGGFGLDGMLVQNVDVQLVRPPFPVCRAAAGWMAFQHRLDWTLTFSHKNCLLVFGLFYR